MDRRQQAFLRIPAAIEIAQEGKYRFLIEYLIGLNDYEEWDFWLYAFNIEDGSILWRQNVGDWFRWSTPVVTDIDNNGQPDVVLGTDSQVMALRGDDGSHLWMRPFPTSGMGMTVADVDGDGWVEIVINDSGDTSRIHLLRGQDGGEIWSEDTGGSAYNIPTVADIDGDGRQEILSHNHLYDPSRERLLVWDEDGNLLWTHLAAPSPEQEAQAPPELGYVPDYGYISTSVADFDGDGQTEIGWGSRCHYYVLNGDGEVQWRVPTVQGYGVQVSFNSDGTLKWVDNHGVGGPSGLAAALGNLDDDPALLLSS